jgi:hypothetical protein
MTDVFIFPKKLQKNLKIIFKKINHTQFRKITNVENQIRMKSITETERRKINFNLKQDISSTSLKQLNQITATEKIVLNSRSYQEAVPKRKQKQTENMSNNKQGETIPMACSSLFSYQMNNQPLEAINNNYSSSNLFQLGTLFKDRKRNNLFSQDAETTQLINKPKKRNISE